MASSPETGPSASPSSLPPAPHLWSFPERPSTMKEQPTGTSVGWGEEGGAPAALLWAAARPNKKKKKRELRWGQRGSEKDFLQKKKRRDEKKENEGFKLRGRENEKLVRRYGKRRKRKRK